MNRVIVKFLSLLVLVLTTTSNGKADFNQNQLRYLSYFDITTYLKRSGTTGQDCSTFTDSNTVVYGYSSPLTGKPVSLNPNFDFLNSFLSCIKNINFEYKASDYFSTEVLEGLGYLSSNFDKVEKIHIDSAIDELTLKLIGPEAVLVSYGYMKSQEEFRDLIYTSAIDMLQKEPSKSTGNFLKNAFILINLRDEFLSY